MKVDICPGLGMPFFPMRPCLGRTLQRPSSVAQLWHEAVEEQQWVLQPELNGERVCFALVQGKVYAQDGFGRAYRRKISNAEEFKRLPDRTCFDGMVFKGDFFPFELLACSGQNLLPTEAHERVRLAKELVRYLKQPWVFETPSLSWLMRRSHNLPHYSGVILKRVNSRYVILGAPTQFDLNWVDRRWP